jgi:MFS family permease
VRRRRRLHQHTSLLHHYSTTSSSFSIQFYAITFSKELNLLGGSLYLGALLGACVELPAYLLLAPLTDSFGRRPAYTFFLLIAAACTLVVNLCVDDDKGGGAAAGAAAAGAAGAAAAVGTRRLVGFAAVLGGRFSSVAAVNVAYIISAEMFPTSCRNSGIGWGTGCGRIGAMLAPLIMATIPHPLVTFSILCLGAALSAWLLPESAGTAMADVPEADRREGILEDGGGDGFSRVGTPNDLDRTPKEGDRVVEFPAVAAVRENGAAA